MAEFFGHDHGTATLVGRAGKELTVKTLQCVHCGGHHLIIPGSGRQRGWCTKCGGFLCGGKKCMAHCEHFMKAIERQERGG